MSTVGHHGEANVDKRLQLDSLKVGQEESLGEDDLGCAVLVLDHALQPVGYHLPQVVVLCGGESIGIPVIRTLIKSVLILEGRGDGSGGGE